MKKNQNIIVIATLAIVSILILSWSTIVFCEQDAWDCPECGKTGNTDLFCGICAHPAPWVRTETELEVPEPIAIRIGDVIRFGHYEQDADLSNGPEEIEWIVLDYNEKENKALLLSKYGLDAQPYNTDNRSVTWEECTLRIWLNKNFADKAFTQTEQSVIMTTAVGNSLSHGYTGWATSGGNDVQDKVFLLSYAEAKQYLDVIIGGNENVTSRVTSTAFASQQGAHAWSGYETTEGKMAVWWWLRSPGINQKSAAIIDVDGRISHSGVSLGNGCVRPALWIHPNAEFTEMETTTAVGTDIEVAEEPTAATKEELEEQISELTARLAEAEARIAEKTNSDEDTEPLVITVLLPEYSSEEDFETENNPVLHKIEEATGCLLQVQWGNYLDYDNTLDNILTEGNMPMLIAAPDARDNVLINAARDGVFWDLTEVVKDAVNYPNLAAGNEQIYNNISVDGRVYGIYRSRAFPRSGIYYRTDIAKAVGFDREVKTLDDLTELAEKLAGYSADTYSLNMCSFTMSTINVITVAFGAPNNWGVDENGDIYPAHLSPAYLEGLNWLRHLYEIGGIDPNFDQISTSDWNDIERTGKAFMRFDTMDNAYRQQEWFEKNFGVTDQIFMIIGPIAKADGSITVWPHNAGFSGEILVTKTVRKEDLPKVLKLLDWLNSDEGQTVLNNGIKNVTYWVDEEGYKLDIARLPEAEYNEKSIVSKKYLHDLNQLSMGVTGRLVQPATKKTALRQRYEDLNREMIPYAVLDPCYPFVSETNMAYGAVLNTILSDAAVQYIAGRITETELRKMWAEWAAMGGDQMTWEYNEAYHAAREGVYTSATD